MNCFFCESSSSYKCPKCLLNYCSLKCYRSPNHLECTEAFYKACIEEEMTLAPPSLDTFEEPIDQFQDLDLDSASQEEILSRLSESQLQHFNDLIDSKQILDLVPVWVPWWQISKPTYTSLENIYPARTTLDLSFNILEILFYYVVTCRSFSYDFDSTSWNMIRQNCMMLKNDKFVFADISQVLESFRKFDNVEFFLYDVKQLLNTQNLMRSFQDLIEIAKLAKETPRIQKKLEFYSWLVSRQDEEFLSQIRNLISGLNGNKIQVL